jgi:hypothetical protein
MKRCVVFVILFSLLPLQSFGDSSTNEEPTVEMTDSNSAETLHDWLLQNNNVVYSVLRFVVNGVTVGSALIYSMNVPGTKALVMGMLAGSESGLIQYNISTYEQWLQNENTARKFNTHIYETDNQYVTVLKKIFNSALDSTEDYGKFALTETASIALSRFAMWLLRIPNLPTGLGSNVIIVLNTAFHATLAQGVAALGLFTDTQVQGKYSGWSEDFQEVFRNTFAFLISMASNAVSTLELVSPGMTGVVDLGFVEIPAGFAAISILGLGFYLHSFYTTWMAVGYEMSEED